jgi:N6-adenosine-specific RNA methylase IME4
MSRLGTSFRAYLDEIGLNKNRANECERIGAIPDQKLPNAFAEAAKEGVLNTIDSMFRFARPFWKIKVRQKKHKKIRDEAEAAAEEAAKGTAAPFGPFPLIYADPPTSFETYTEGSYRGPNQHYPTLSWDEIENFAIDGKRVSEIAHEDAMLFLWCTSSNIPFALRVMEAWGFDFKASAAWDKGVMGTGLIFRNVHELLFYGSRGNVPGPVSVSASVFRYPRGRHSAKPPEVRLEIERMYPNYDASTRLELFSRDNVAGWTHFGLRRRRRGKACRPTATRRAASFLNRPMPRARCWIIRAGTAYWAGESPLRKSTIRRPNIAASPSRPPSLLSVGIPTRCRRSSFSAAARRGLVGQRGEMSPTWRLLRRGRPDERPPARPT